MESQSDAFRGWALINRDRMRQSGFLLSGDWFLADDLVQDALVRIYQAWPRLSRTANLDAYARRVLLNLYLDHRRRPWRRERLTDHLPDRPASASDTLDERERLLAALRRVPPRQRAVLVLRYWDDLSIDQTAQLLGTSAGNVKSQTSRGLAALRSALADAGPPDLYTFKEK